MQLPLFAEVNRAWDIPPDPSWQDCVNLHKELNIPILLAKILVARGISTPTDARLFLHPSRDQLRDPFALADMDRLVGRLIDAVERREKIRICGDYDVDGISATAILWLGLTRLGADVDYWLPHRIQDGYGLSAEVVDEAAGDGRKLLVTVDNGISAFAAAQRAVELGVDLLITDHHAQTEPHLPPAIAVVNPNRLDHPYPFSGLSGSAIAWKVVDALYQRLGIERPWKLLAYACLGIIADVAPLLDENRIMVREGLEELKKQPLPGLRALFRHASLEPEQINAKTVSFVLAPRLNSAGRIGSPESALALLICEDDDEARRLADALEHENERRRAIGDKVLREASIQLAAGLETSYDSPLIALSGRWHLGVLGIAAARLAEQWNKPVLLAGLEDDEGEWLRGSARSTNGIDITQLLAACSEWLEQFGGHPGAAGFRLRAELWTDFCEAALASIDRIREEQFQQPVQRADCRVSVDEITPEFMECLRDLEPFGEGNEEPLLYFEGLLATEARKVGKKADHLRIRLPNGWTAIAFNQGDMQEIAANGYIDLIATPRWNEWQGVRSIQLQVQALRPHASSTVKLWRSWVQQTAERVYSEKPDRSMLVSIYKGLRVLQQRGLNVLPQAEELAQKLGALGIRVLPTALRHSLQIFSELGLVVPMQRGQEECWVLGVAPENKIDLEDSPTYRGCQQERRQWYEFTSWCAKQDDAATIEQRVLDMLQ